MKTFVIVPAGGKGKRGGTATPKQYIRFHGKELIVYTLEAFQQNVHIDEIILAFNPDIQGEETIMYLKTVLKNFKNIKILAPEKSVVNASFPAAVAAGNVETSTRIVDVVLGALAQALPDRIPAASHGSMNNLAMGHVGDQIDDMENPAWDYYETIGGGMGASEKSDGLDAVQTHMTNTLNTPIEALEMKYPVRVTRYQIRQGSAGFGKYKGGEGLIREYEFLAPAQVTILSERRNQQPWGLLDGGNAKEGVNLLNRKLLPAKHYFNVKQGDVVCIKTPGGGGFG